MRQGLSFLVVLISLFFSFTALAQIEGSLHSQKRHLGEHGDEAAQRYFDRIIRLGLLEGPVSGTPNGLKKPYDQLDFDDVTSWTGLELDFWYRELRDTRYIEQAKKKGFLRRISWLYPDDGCFARAGMMKIFLEQVLEKNQIPTRVFIFGSLKVKTPNHPNGEVRWWYHTAPVVNVAGDVYVIDPAIDPNKPLKLDQWALHQVDNLSQATFAFCHADTYHPSSNCEKGGDYDKQIKSNQMQYLNREWKRQIQLKRDPKLVLGDSPPWLMN